MPKSARKTMAEAVKAAIESAEGRSALAQAMVKPLMAWRDYDSVGRKAFTSEPIIPCPSCGRTVTEEGADGGCRECVARSVMES